MKLSYTFRELTMSEVYGAVALVSRGGEHAILQWCDGEWLKIVDWIGAEVWGLASAGTALFTVDEAHLLHIWDGSARRQLSLPTDVPLFDVAALENGAVWVVGDLGCIIECDIGASRITVRRLREFGITKPGRGILRCRSMGDHAYLCGRAQLLVRYCAAGATALLPAARARREFAIWDVAEMESMIWISGLDGLRPRIGKVVCDSIRFGPELLDIAGAPSMVPARRGIWIVRDSIWWISQEADSVCQLVGAANLDPFTLAVALNSGLLAVRRSGTVEQFRR